jgi:hypothetical protein
LTLLVGKPVVRPPAVPITKMWAVDLIGAKYHDYTTRAENHYETLFASFSLQKTRGPRNMATTLDAA